MSRAAGSSIRPPFCKRWMRAGSPAPRSTSRTPSRRWMDPIYHHPKVVLTPHVSWTGGEDAKRLADKTLVNLDAYAHGVALADVFDKNLEY
jgi:phosphoglycerate dehydrogenase-like enzyme